MKTSRTKEPAHSHASSCSPAVKHRTSVLGALAGIAALVALGVVPAPASARSCGSLRAYYRDVSGSSFVQASSIDGEGLRCPRARHVAWDWARKSRLSGNPARTGAGFRCRYDRLGSDVGSVTCTYRLKSVTFDAYDSSGYH